MTTSVLRAWKAAVGSHPLALLVMGLLLGGPARAADAVLDFRTLIPGILDVPVYRADGTNRPSWTTGCMALLYAAVDLHGLDFSPVARVMPFGTGDQAGYVWFEDPVPVVVPKAQAGDRVWVTMRAWEPYQGFYIPEDQPPNRFEGESEPFSLIVSNTPTPLIGLRSFAFKVPPLQIRSQGGTVVLRWSAGDGTVYYDVEMTSTLGVPGSWRNLGRWPVLDRRSVWNGMGTWWEADWVMTNTVWEAMTLYRVRLLNP